MIIPPPEGPAKEAGGPYPTPSNAVLLALLAALGRALAAGLLAPLFGPRIAVLGMATILGFGSVFAFAAPRLPQPPGPHLGFRPAGARAWQAALFLVFALLLISEVDNVLQDWLPREPPTEAPDLDGVALLERVLVLVLVIPFVEEVFFRGLLHPGLVAALGRTRAVALNAVLQAAGALLLYGPWGVPFALGYGLLLGLLREAGSSLLPCLALRAAFGLVGFAAALGLLGIPGFDDTSARHTPLVWLLPAAALVGIGLGLCRAALRSEQVYRPPEP